jgi:serine/threonine-protein kinase HipA
MAIQLVGETIDRRRAHSWAQEGGLIPLVRGVYALADQDIDAAVLGHAVRIAHYLYPQAYLSSASAALLAPTADGRLFLSGRRNQRTRLRGLEIVQNAAPAKPSLDEVVVGDDMGEFRLAASSLRQRFLEAFRLRSEHASAIRDDLRAQWAERLIETYGAPKAAADALWILARELEWYREGEGAERYLLRGAGTAPAPVNKAALDRLVGWHGRPVGRLSHDGHDWRWRPQDNDLPPLVRDTAPGRLPPFIESLLPEGWLANVLRREDPREALRSGRRYMSNVTMVDTEGELKHLPRDDLQIPLGDFSENGRFTGRYQGPEPGHLDATFAQNLAELYANAETPRLSGVQIKAPMCLRRDGALVAATEDPFTHILKPAGTGGYEMLPVVEWLCLELGRRVGFEVPPAALIDMPDGMPRALLVERFDIRRSSDETRLFALEDFCSVLDLPPSDKYKGTIERVAKALRALSSLQSADLETLFRRAAFAWCIADGDMHLKNLALLKIGQPGAKAFATLRFAPLYDAVTTQVFPDLAHDRMHAMDSLDEGALQKVDLSQRVRPGRRGPVERLRKPVAHGRPELPLGDLRLPGGDRRDPQPHLVPQPVEPLGTDAPHLRVGRCRYRNLYRGYPALSPGSDS